MFKGSANRLFCGWVCPCVIGENATCCGSGGNGVTSAVDADKEFVSRSGSSSVFTVTTCGGVFSGKLAKPGSVGTEPNDG